MVRPAFLELREKDVARQCDDLVRKLGGTVVATNPPHKMKQDFGVPDRRYRVCRTAFYFELKKPGRESKLSRKQYEFLVAELDHGCLAACGVLEDLLDLVNVLRLPAGAGDPVATCRAIVERWAARGFRGEKKAKLPPGYERKFPPKACPSTQRLGRSDWRVEPLWFLGVSSLALG